MIKFTLIIWVCSFLGQQTCMKPLEYPLYSILGMNAQERRTKNPAKYSLKWDIKRLMNPELELSTTVDR